jgi:hypothetical protein
VVDLTGGDRQIKIDEGRWLGIAVTNDLPKRSFFCWKHFQYLVSNELHAVAFSAVDRCM